MKSLVDKVVEVLEPVHNGGEQMSLTARKVIDVVLNHKFLAPDADEGTGC